MAEMMDLIENIAKSTEGGAKSTGGGEISIGGGEISIAGGEISIGGGEISIEGAKISTGGGAKSTGGEAISIGGGMIFNRVSTNLKGRAYSRTFQGNYQHIIGLRQAAKASINMTIENIETRCDIVFCQGR